ncbi:AraC family transcriptional regulator [Kiritimatiellota bacterium B12222]|nr:AraC family transcriptional regulator [Kiritimatiellota bacterium B12222]
MFMIYFDLSPVLCTNFTAAIFHGKPLSPSVIHRVLGEMGLPWPHQVQAVGVSGGPDLSSLLRFSMRETPKLDVATHPRLISLHSGLYYVLSPLNAELETWGPMARVGQAQVATGAEKWISSLQQAVVSLREHELKVMGAPGTATLVSKQDEQDAARRVISLARRHAPDWEEAASDWLRLCMIRHQRMLNIVRRKIVDLVSSLTRADDENDRLSFLYTDFILRVYQTHTFWELEEVTLSSLRDFVALLGAEKGMGGQNGIVGKAIGYLGDHHAELISLKDVAEATHVSASHLARRFREETGVSVMTYLHRLRIARAKQLLAESDETVLSVALDCGFESPEHFHRIFKRLTHTTPRRYRLDARVDRV